MRGLQKISGLSASKGDEFDGLGDAELPIVLRKTESRATRSWYSGLKKTKRVWMRASASERNGGA
jgi:hypothetical protein